MLHLKKRSGIIIQLTTRLFKCLVDRLFSLRFYNKISFHLLQKLSVHTYNTEESVLNTENLVSLIMGL